MKSFTSDRVHLGFVGVGAMGSRLVRRLCDHGYQSTVYDLDRCKAVALVDHGAWVANSTAELAENADVILSCLTDDDAGGDVYMGRNGILSNAIPGKVALEMSTISPASSRKLYRRRQKRRQRYGCPDLRQHSRSQAGHRGSARRRRQRSL